MDSETGYKPEELIQQYGRLRGQAHDDMLLATKQRLQDNPIPNDEEVQLGFFREMMEPQVTDAIFEMHRKGYSTLQSGFGALDGSTQYILMKEVDLDEEVLSRLAALGVSVKIADDPQWKGNQIMELRFDPDQPNLDAIRKKWNEVAAILPDREKTGRRNLSGMAVRFRQRFAPAEYDKDIRYLEARAADVSLSSEYRSRMEMYLDNLKNRKIDIFAVMASASGRPGYFE